MPNPASPLNWPDLSGGLVLPFVFIPDGAPEPSEWPFPRSGAVRLPARFVPSRDDGGWRDRPAPQAMIRPANDPISASAAWWSADEASSPDTWGVKRRPAAYGWAASSPAAPPDQAAKLTPARSLTPDSDPRGSQNQNQHPAMPGNAAPNDRPLGVTPQAAAGDGAGPRTAASLGSYPVAGNSPQPATTRQALPQPGAETVDLTNDGAGTIDALKNLGSYVYRNLLQQPATDMRDLLSNPDKIPNAVASVLPGFAPVIGDVPQAVSRAITALRALDKVQGSDAFSQPTGETAAGPEVSASTPRGQRGLPITVPPGTNRPTTIEGRIYTGHALDQMQGQGVPPSAVEDAIQHGQTSLGNSPGTFVHMGKNGVRVIIGSKGQVITVINK